MSHFDLPRINFHGSALLDTATANNGNYEPALTMFDQNESEAFLPPRCYLPKDYTYSPPPGVQILHDKKGDYVPISAITADNYQQWAITPLGKFKDDYLYASLYKYLGKSGINPGYWNYFGDLSVSLINTKVSGITLAKTGGGVSIYTPENQLGCPDFFANMFGAEFSFNNDFFAEDSRTSAYFCDVDSIGQMCTQLFCGQAGLYKTDENGNQLTLFNGNPVKSTSRWMNLTKVLNYSDHNLIPMAGSATFYAKIKLNNGDTLLNEYQKYTGKTPTGLFMKLMIHEVYEVREPDYSKIPTNTIDAFGNQVEIPKNPAKASVSGSITPYYDEDMQTASIGRLLKNDTAVNIPPSDKILPPETYDHKKLDIPTSVNLAPVQFIHNKQFNLLSLDLSNSINEYGKSPGTKIAYSGPGDIPEFQDFESYDFGDFSVHFQPDSGGASENIGSFNFDKHYNLKQLLAAGGMVDLIVDAGKDFSNGQFYLSINNSKIFEEDNYFITSDQMGNYAQQFQSDTNYMSNGLPRVPCILRVFYRGTSVSQAEQIKVTEQTIDMRTQSITNKPDVNIYDGKELNFDVKKDGCLTYGFIDSQSQQWDGEMPNLFKYVMNTSLVVTRTLSAEPQLADYLERKLPITWELVFNNVFSLFKVLYPIMDAVLPFTEKNWSDPFILNKMKVLISDSNWDKPLYMPITRDLSAPQQKLLQLWIEQVVNNASNQ